MPDFEAAFRKSCVACCSVFRHLFFAMKLWGVKKKVFFVLFCFALCVIHSKPKPTCSGDNKTTFGCLSENMDRDKLICFRETDVRNAE